MVHADIRKELARCVAGLRAGACRLPVELRPYQYETLQSMETWLSDPTGSARAHVVYATGLGKTILFSALIAASVGLRILVVVPTKHLLEQTARVIVGFTGGIIGQISSVQQVLDDAGKIIAVRAWNQCDVVVTTDESLALRAQQIATHLDPQLVIYDECHWSYRHPALKALEHFPEAVVIGFTATPDYLTNIARQTYAPVALDNGMTLYGPVSRFASTHFGVKLDERSVMWGIEEGYLAPLSWGRMSLEDVSLDDVPLVETEAGLDYKQDALKRKLDGQWQRVCDAVVRLYDDPEYDLKNHHVFSICASVQNAEQLAWAMAETGVTSACVTGKTPDWKRREILQSFRNGKIRFVSSVMVLREGWDSPNADVCLMLRPTKSRVLYMQSIGRVLRVLPDGTYKMALVIDAHFQKAEFAPLSAPVVFGEPGQQVRVGGVLLGDSRRAWDKNDADVVTVEKQNIEKELLADERGVITFQEEEWWSVSAFAVYPGMQKLSTLSIQLRARRGGVRMIKGYTARRFASTFYALKDLLAIFTDRLTTRPHGDDRGILTFQGKEWWSVWTFVHKHKLKDELTVRTRIKNSTVPSVNGLNERNMPCTFYDLHELRRICADLIGKVLRED